jgi:hypothetical protein
MLERAHQRLKRSLALSRAAVLVGVNLEREAQVRAAQIHVRCRRRNGETASAEREERCGVIRARKHSLYQRVGTTGAARGASARTATRAATRACTCTRVATRATSACRTAMLCKTPF